MDTETELKVRLSSTDFQDIRKILRSIGGKTRTANQVENNILFDYTDNRLQKSGCALRLRSYNGIFLLTFKGKVQGNTFLKKRSEIQTPVSHFKRMKDLLQQIGLHPKFLYSKKREIWVLGKESDTVEISLDPTPFGFFLEIEGREKAILKASDLLGINFEDAITESYVTLYRKEGLGSTLNV